jgi:hypothetical protein
MQAAMEFAQPDRIPVRYADCAGGLYVHSAALQTLLQENPPDNAISFDSLPAPPADAFDANGRYHQTIEDEWGTTWEYRLFGVAGHPIAYPFDSWAEAKEFTFPPLPSAEKETFAEIRAENRPCARNSFCSTGGFRYSRNCTSCGLSTKCSWTLARGRPTCWRSWIGWWSIASARSKT